MLKTILFCFLLVPQTVQFQVIGQVDIDAQHRGGRARLESPDGRIVIRADVDRDGEFEFQDVLPGSYLVTVQLAGFENLRRSLEVRPSLADTQGRISMSIELAEDALDEGQLTVSVMELGIPSEALREYRRALEAGGAIETVRKHLQKAVEIAPHFGQALNNLGTTYHRQGDYARSIELFERALVVDSENFQAQVNLGGSLLADQQLERAVEENLRALDLRPNSSLANAQMGMAFFFLRLDAEAIPYFEKVKELDRFSLTTPELFLSDIYLRNGESERAVGELERFLQKLPDHPQAKRVRERLRRLGPDDFS